MKNLTKTTMIAAFAVGLSVSVSAQSTNAVLKSDKKATPVTVVPEKSMAPKPISTHKALRTPDKTPVQTATPAPAVSPAKGTNQKPIAVTKKSKVSKGRVATQAQPSISKSTK